MRGSLAVAAGARLSLRIGARLRGLEATTRLPRRICRGSRVARALGRPEDGRPARKSESALNLGGLESWADEPAAAEAPRSSARWDDAWEDTWPERRASASRGSRPDFGLDDNGEPVDRAGTSGDAEWDEDLDGDGDPYGDGDGDGDPYAYRDAYSPRDAPASFGESLPGAAGAAVSWLLKAVALVSDATATNLAFLFPRAVPRATLRALAFGAWALLFFAVFQKLLSTIVPWVARRCSPSPSPVASSRGAAPRRRGGTSRPGGARGPRAGRGVRGANRSTPSWTGWAAAAAKPFGAARRHGPRGPCASSGTPVMSPGTTFARTGTSTLARTGTIDRRHRSPSSVPRTRAPTRRRRLKTTTRFRARRFPEGRLRLARGGHRGGGRGGGHRGGRPARGGGGGQGPQRAAPEGKARSAARPGNPHSGNPHSGKLKPSTAPPARRTRASRSERRARCVV